MDRRLKTLKTLLIHGMSGNQVRWIPTTAMLVDAMTKHLVDQTVLNQFLQNNDYSLREDPRLEEQRIAARAARKAKAKAKTKSVTS